MSRLEWTVKFSLTLLLSDIFSEMLYDLVADNYNKYLSRDNTKYYPKLWPGLRWSLVYDVSKIVLIIIFFQHTNNNIFCKNCLFMNLNIYLFY